MRAELLQTIPACGAPRAASRYFIVSYWIQVHCPFRASFMTANGQRRYSPTVVVRSERAFAAEQDVKDVRRLDLGPTSVIVPTRPPFPRSFSASIPQHLYRPSSHSEGRLCQGGPSPRPVPRTSLAPLLLATISGRGAIRKPPRAGHVDQVFP